MQVEYVRAGSTSVRIPVHIVDTSTLTATDNTAGRGKTGLAYNTASLTCYYFRENQGNNASTVLSLVTYTRGAAWTSGGFVEQDATNTPGDYWLCLSDAVVAAGAGWAMVTLKGAANMVQTTIKIILTDDPAIVIGVCAGGGSQTSIITSSLVPTASVTDQFKGRIVIFDKNTTTAALQGQAKDITASTTGGVLTVTALTTAPASGDSFRVY